MLTLRLWLYSSSRKLRGYLHRLRWLLKGLVRIALEVTSAIITFLLLAMPKGDWLAYLKDPANYGVFFASVTVVTLVGGWIALQVRTHTLLAFDALPPLTTGVTRRPGEQISVCPHNRQALLFDPVVNARLQVACNPLVVKTGVFALHPLIRQMTASFIFAMPETAADTTDDPKVRLLTDISPHLLDTPGTAVLVQRTSYFRDRLSNTLANYQVRLEGRPLLNLRQEVLDAQGSLVPLSRSTLSNQLGAGTMLITADGSIIYLRQGNRAAENPRRLAPSGSGSFDFPRDPKMLPGCFQDFVRQEALRELCEECDLTPADVIDIHITGYGRSLYRNGKPEFFCLAVTRRHAQSIQVPLREWDFQQPEVESYLLRGPLNARIAHEAFSDFFLNIEQGGEGLEPVSGPLYWGVLFARDYLANLDAAGEAVLFGR